MSGTPFTATAAVTGSAWLGLLAGIAASTALSLIHGFASITHNGNQVVSGMALNIMVAGLCPVLAQAWFRQSGQTPMLGQQARFGPIELPFAQALAKVPVIGIGAGADVDGQILVLYDILGITQGRLPRFAKNFMRGRDSPLGALRAYVLAVKDRSYPAEEHTFVG